MSTGAGMVRGAARDACVVALVVLAAVYAGSGRLAHFDPALAGYLGATLVALVSLAYRVSCFWRRPPSAFYGRVLLRALRHPHDVLDATRAGARDIVGQRFILRRSRVRWLAHMSLAWGTLAAFAITLPLVFGWIHFEAAGSGSYQAFVFSLPALRFGVSGALGWLIFNSLNLAAVAVVCAALCFVAMRVRQRHEAGVTSRFNLAPLMLLLGVAVTGLALPFAAAAGSHVFLTAAQVSHEAAVIALLVALPYAKLSHVFIRPLHLGAQLGRRASVPRAHCRSCKSALAPHAQLDAVESILLAHGFRFAGHQHLCPTCRRQRLAVRHSAVMGGRFQPRYGVSS